MRPATRAVHTGHEPGPNAPLAPAIHAASTFEWDSFAEEPPLIYSRYTNQNREMLQDTIAALENGRFAVAYASGMAAMAAALSIAQHGDHVLVAADVYGGTLHAGTWLLPRQGIEFGTFDITRVESLLDQLKPNTKLIVFESPTNPTIRIADIRKITSIAAKANVLTVFDNTFATPYLQSPLALGADVVMHSTTKYLGGHSDVIGGVLVTNRSDLNDHFLKYAKVGGAVPGPFDCWLVLRGIRSLAPRMKMMCESAQRVAEFLAQHPAIEKVHYPGLQNDEGHELAKSQMSGFGAMLAFEIEGGAEEAIAFAQRCSLFKRAASLGGCESSLSYPPVLSHAALSEEQRMGRGIPPNLMRASIGLEDVEDLFEDLESALQKS